MPARASDGRRGTQDGIRPWARRRAGTSTKAKEANATATVATSTQSSSGSTGPE